MIEQMLIEYREKKALLAFKERDIEGHEKMLEYCNQKYIEPEREAIEGMSMAASTISDIPRSETNKIGSSTERTATYYREECNHKNDFILEVTSIKRNIIRLEQESKPLREVVDTVDICIKILDAKEKFIIIRKYLRGYNIPEIVTLFAKNFGYGSNRTIENIIQRSIEKMDDLLNKKSA